jgi:hypothetical protein
MTPDQIVEEWNVKHPVGTRVYVIRDNGEIMATHTTRQPMILGGDTPIVWIEGVSGCWSLDQVIAATETGVRNGITRLWHETERLRSAIREHRDQKGDSRCWLDDWRLYQALGDGCEAETRLPPKCEFLESCRRYWEQRQASGEKVEAVDWTGSGRMTIAQLEEEVTRLRAIIGEIK